jgi:hypothetical protein
MKKSIFVSMVAWYTLSISLGSAMASIGTILSDMPEEEIRFVWKGFGALCGILAGMYLILGCILSALEYQENKQKQ